MSVKLRSRKTSKGHITFYLDIYDKGHRYYEFLSPKIKPSDNNKREQKNKFEQIARLRAEELQAENYGYLAKHLQNVDFIEYFRTFLENYPNKDHRLVRYSLEKFLLFYPKKKLLAKQLTTEICEGYAKFLKSDECGLKGETPHNYFVKFKKVIKAAVKDGVLKKNPITDGKKVVSVTRQNNQLKKQVLTEDELQLLAKTLCGNEQVKRAFLFACLTGLGYAEIKNLTWASIANDKLNINRAKTGTQIWNDLPPSALKLLGEAGPKQQAIFSLPSDVSTGKTIKNWVKRAGIEKNISFYCGRHSFAVLLMLKGANLKTVADCLGHANTKHTIKYLNYVDSLKSDAINKLPILSI